jgi:hypothetical protein
MTTKTTVSHMNLVIPHNRTEQKFSLTISLAKKIQIYPHLLIRNSIYVEKIKNPKWSNKALIIS